MGEGDAGRMERKVVEGVEGYVEGLGRFCDSLEVCDRREPYLFLSYFFTLILI